MPFELDIEKVPMIPAFLLRAFSSEYIMIIYSQQNLSSLTRRLEGIRGLNLKFYWISLKCIQCNFLMCNSLTKFKEIEPLATNLIHCSQASYLIPIDRDASAPLQEWMWRCQSLEHNNQWFMEQYLPHLCQTWHVITDVASCYLYWSTSFESLNMSLYQEFRIWWLVHYIEVLQTGGDWTTCRYTGSAEVRGRDMMHTGLEDERCVVTEWWSTKGRVKA